MKTAPFIKAIALCAALALHLTAADTTGADKTGEYSIFSMRAAMALNVSSISAEGNCAYIFKPTSTTSSMIGNNGYFIDANYDMGLRNLVKKGPGGEAYNRSWVFAVGYKRFF